MLTGFKGYCREDRSNFSHRSNPSRMLPPLLKLPKAGVYIFTCFDTEGETSEFVVSIQGLKGLWQKLPIGKINQGQATGLDGYRVGCPRIVPECSSRLCYL
ncbi:unnamed protein product [Calypogeia fissa]